MYFTVKAILRSLLLPPASPLILALIGALLMPARRRLGTILLICSLAFMWLFSTEVVADMLTQVAERCPAFDFTKPTEAQAIVVIGGGGMRLGAPEYQGPATESLLLERLTYAAFLARKTGLPVMVSGAPEESVVMQTSLLRDFGITARWVDNESADTYENARFSARILQALGIRRVILVTMSTHMYRAALEYRSAGFDVTPAPSGVWTARESGVMRFVPTPGALLRSNSAVYELIGEPMRRLQAALGVREIFDTKAGAFTKGQ